MLTPVRTTLASLDDVRAAGGKVPTASLTVFAASGSGHAAGIVPDPGASAGTTKYLREDGTWVAPSGGGSGTVTSVAMTLPGVIFNASVAGSPVTTSGTLAPTLATQVANTHLAGPATGADATPTFRALVAADIPSLAASIITSGTMATARLGSGTASSSTYLRGDQTWATVSSGVAVGGAVSSGSASRVLYADSSQNVAESASLAFDGTTFTTNAIATVAGTAFSATATAPAAAASTAAGVGASLTASAAIAGTTNAGAAAGGSVTVTAGAAARFTSGNANGGDIVTVPGAGIGTGTAGNVIVRQPGGTPGTHEVQVSHNGTDGKINQKSGKLRFGNSGNCFEDTLGGIQVDGSRGLFTHDNVVSYQSSVLGGSSWAITWSSIANWFSGSLDLGLKRAAAKVLSVTDASTGGGTLRSIPLIPAQITADTNNYAPGVAMFYRLSTDASRNITGLSISQVDGQMCEFWNVGSFPIVLQHQNANSTAANRFQNASGLDVVLNPSDRAQLEYDGTSAYWRVARLTTDLASGTFVVRQPGGTPGTHEVQVSHNGTDTTVASKSGKLIFTTSAGNYSFQSASSRVDVLAIAVINGGLYYVYGSSAGLRVGNGGHFGFTSSDAFNASDAGLKRAAAKVINVTDGSSAGGTFASIPLTPAQITADTNNYAPGVAMFYRLSTDASRNITGLSCSQVDGQVAEIWNVGSNNIVLTHQDAGSTAANQFLCTGAASITLAANEVVLLRYDGTTARWRARKV